MCIVVEATPKWNVWLPPRIFRILCVTYESDSNLVSSETDNILYPHINNDTEYGLFKDIIDSYYLDSQIKDDFMCYQNCYTKTQHKQKDHTVTPCMSSNIVMLLIR